MRATGFLVLALLGCGLAQAQSDPVSGLGSASAESQRIEAERIRQNAAFDAQDAACYQRFSVNACLAKVAAKRRAVLADLKRQEASLHDSERLQKGGEQLRRTEQKAVERQQKEAEIQAEDTAATTLEKLQAQKDKKAEHAAKAASASDVRTPSAPTGPTAADQAQYRDSYARKQAEAAKKRLEVAKRLKEKDSVPAQPLPPPK
jgi:hypothetical protein